MTSGDPSLPSTPSRPPTALPGEAARSHGGIPHAQDQEKALDKYEHVVQGLQKRGQQVVPLKYRRETPLKPIPVEALCDFEGDQVSCCPGAPGRPGPNMPLFMSLNGLRVTSLNEGLKRFQDPSLGSFSARPVPPHRPPLPPQ